MTWFDGFETGLLFVFLLYCMKQMENSLLEGFHRHGDRIFSLEREIQRLQKELKKNS